MSTPRSLVRHAVITLLLVASPIAARGAAAQTIPTPEQFFGFQMGADRKLAHWDDLVRYYTLLGESSRRLRVVNMGPTTMGHPFLALYVSSPANLERLEELRQINATLSDPRKSAQRRWPR